LMRPEPKRSAFTSVPGRSKWERMVAIMGYGEQFTDKMLQR